MSQRSLAHPSDDRSRNRRASLLLLLVVGAALLVALPSALARTTSDDVIVRVGLWKSQSFTEDKTTASLNFQIAVQVESTSGVGQEVTIRIGLPEGLHWGDSRSKTAQSSCTGVAPAVCTVTLQGSLAGAGYSQFWWWSVVADRYGTYEVTGTVETTEPDPNLANNTDTLRFEIVQPTTGGGSGGGGSGGGGVAALRVGTVKLSPAKPKAGSTLVASVRVTRGGSSVRPSGIACAASIGKAKVKGKGKGRSGLASCRFKTPKSGKHKKLAGSISFRAGGESFSKRFSTRLR